MTHRRFLFVINVQQLLQKKRSFRLCDRIQHINIQNAQLSNRITEGETKKKGEEIYVRNFQ